MDLNGIGNVTTDHEKIKAWAEKRGGIPKIIDHPGALADEIGLRIDFPGSRDNAFIDENIEREVSWEAFFGRFEEEGLAFIYEDRESDDPNSLYKFVKREIIK